MNNQSKPIAAIFLAVGGLCLSTVSFAQCPASPTAWTSTTQTGGTIVVNTPGYASTTCKMVATVTPGATEAAQVRVRDETPAGEIRYRAKFLMNANGLGVAASNARVKIFNGQIPNGSGVFQLKLTGAASGYAVTGFASCRNSTENDGRCRFSFPLPAGDLVHRIELEWVKATSDAATDGTLRYWVNAAGAAPAPTGTAFGAGGAGLRNFNFQDGVTAQAVDQVNLGLIRPNLNYISQEIGNGVGFDEFESRRQTYIGG